MINHSGWQFFPVQSSVSSISAWFIDNYHWMKRWQNPNLSETEIVQINSSKCKLNTENMVFLNLTFC